ncbi:hypothetical protein LINGRAHAP2_LOCUS15163 [Linum grandiflorum]
MLTCASEAEVQRILLLNRRKFGNIRIQMDVWLMDAGRSRVSFERDVVWLNVHGIVNKPRLKGDSRTNKRRITQNI